MSVSRCRHIGPSDAVPDVGISVEVELVALIHRWWRVLVVTSTNQVKLGLLTDLHALIVVGQGHLNVVHSVVEFLTADSVGLTIILQQCFGVLFQHIDKSSQVRKSVVDHWNRVLVLSHDLLDLLLGDAVVRADLVALLDVLEKGFVALTLTASWA